MRSLTSQSGFLLWRGGLKRGGRHVLLAPHLTKQKDIEYEAHGKKSDNLAKSVALLSIQVSLH